jgi:hypothetical protein
MYLLYIYGKIFPYKAYKHDIKRSLVFLPPPSAASSSSSSTFPSSSTGFLMTEGTEEEEEGLLDTCLVTGKPDCLGRSLPSSQTEV